MRTIDRVPRKVPRKKIFPFLVTPVDKEMLTRLAVASGLSRGAVVRQLILRETASRELIRQAPHETALARRAR